MSESSEIVKQLQAMGQQAVDAGEGALERLR